MTTKPQWLTKLTPAQRIAILTKAHAILLDDSELGNNPEIRAAAAVVWTIKSKLERIE